MMEKTKTIGRVMAALEQGLLRPSSAVAAACDPAATRRFLELLRAPEVNCTEFRVLRAGLDRQGKIRRAEDVGLHQGGSTLAGWYDDMELLTAHTRRLRAVSGYVTINPVRPKLLARCNNRLVDIGAQAQERRRRPGRPPQGISEIRPKSAPGSRQAAKSRDQ